MLIDAKPVTKGTIRKRKGISLSQPVTLNMPDCSVNPVYTTGLDKKYGDRSIEITARMSKIIYYVAIGDADDRNTWTKALTLASLTLPTKGLKNGGKKEKSDWFCVNQQRKSF